MGCRPTPHTRYAVRSPERAAYRVRTGDPLTRSHPYRGLVTSTRVVALDGLRGLAILLVVIAHAAPATLPQLGPLGVIVFFVLSGYLITSILMAEHDATGSIDVRRFFRKRAARLIPAMLVVVLAYLLTLLIWARQTEFYRGLVGAALGVTYLMDVAMSSRPDIPLALTPLWSLAVEEHFYLAWPVVIAVVLSRADESRLRVLVRMIVGLSFPCLIMMAALQAHTTIDLYFLPTTWIGSLAVGAQVALWARTFADATLKKSVPRLVGTGFWTSLLVAFVVVVMTTLLARRGLLQASVTAGLVGLLLCRLIRIPNTWLARLLEWTPIVALGRVSYSVYLLNLPLMELVRAVGIPFPRLVGGVVSFPLAWLLWRVVERPALRRWSPAPSLSARPGSPALPLTLARVVANERTTGAPDSPPRVDDGGASCVTHLKRWV